jgi:hypothetical protein
MKRLYVLALLAAASLCLAPNCFGQTGEPRHDLVIYAHADDWPLFFGDDVENLLRHGDLVTFIDLTFGGGCNEPADLAAIITAVNDDGQMRGFLCGKGNDPGLAVAAVCTPDPDHRQPLVNGHWIEHCHFPAPAVGKGSASIYLLYLPHGNCPWCGDELQDGPDRAGTMLKFFTEPATSFHSLNFRPEDRATYQNWNDLEKTVLAIYMADHKPRYKYGYIISNDPKGSSEWVPYHGPETTLPAKHDNVDHSMAGCLALSVFDSYLHDNVRFGIHLFRGYNVLNYYNKDGPNVTSEQLQTKERLFHALAGSDAWGIQADSDGYIALMSRHDLATADTPDPAYQGGDCEYIRQPGFVFAGQPR